MGLPWPSLLMLDSLPSPPVAQSVGSERCTHVESRKLLVRGKFDYETVE